MTGLPIFRLYSTMVQIVDPADGSSLHEGADGLYAGDVLRYPLRDGAYRLVSEGNYTDNFGLEWNTFQRTQIDKFSGSDVSQRRFFAESAWTPESLNGLDVLEVGSGAGRFSQVVLDHTRANLYSVDYSGAVEANFRNNGPHPRLKLFQASVYELPFPKASFPRVFCLGVLQHTPDFRASVQCLADKVAPGGELVVDFYPVRGWYTYLHAKYILRPITRRMNHDLLMRLVRANAGWMIGLSRFFSKMGVGLYLNRFIPVCDIDRTLPAGMGPEQLREWVVLDTFDMFSPRYDSPQRIDTVVRWFRESGMQDVWGGWVEYAPGLHAAIVRGRKPA